MPSAMHNYSPTSEASVAGDDAVAAFDTEITAKLDTTETICEVEPEVEAQAEADALRREEVSTGPKPVVLVGPRFDKEYALTPNRWVKIGRSKKAHLLLKNTGVSRNHCSLRWDRHRQVVELDDTSSAGTLVNGDTVKYMRRTLHHGDRVRVEGKGMRYDFVLDLRPVSLAFSDPRTENKDIGRKKLKGPALLQRRDNLKAQLSALDVEIDKLDSEAFSKEREFHDIALRRTLRLEEDKQRQEDMEKYLAGKKALEEKIQRGRKEWLAKLQAQQTDNGEETRPLMEAVGERQVKVEKLQLKKDELERTIHPERYAVADVGSFMLQMPTPKKTPSVHSSREQPVLTDARDDDEDPFANLADDPEGRPGTGALAQPEPTSEALLAVEQRESSSAYEPEAKRSKVA